MVKIKSLIKECVPPFILKKITTLFYGWRGNYSSWEEAKKYSTGYDTDIILEKVKDAVLKVKNGEAVYERDSILFDKVHYSFPLLSALSWVALRNDGKLNVLDFGGSLGSSYFQNKHFLTDLKEVNWCVVEQKHFVEEGKANFKSDQLHFFYDIKSCLESFKINVVLLSSVLQYLEKPYDLLLELINEKTEYIIIDRAPLLISGKDRITVQTVPKNIYHAKYPSWILNEENLLKLMEKDYDLVFDGILQETINISNAEFKSFFFKRKY